MTSTKVCSQKRCTADRQPRQKCGHETSCRQKLFASIFTCDKPRGNKNRCGCESSPPDNMPPMFEAPKPEEDGRGGPPEPPPGANLKPLWKMPSLQRRQATRPRSILVPPNYQAKPLPLIGSGRPRLLKTSPHQTTARQVDKAKANAAVRRLSAARINAKLSQPTKLSLKPANAPRQIPRLPIPEHDSIRSQPQTKVTPPVTKSKIRRTSAEDSSLKLAIPENPLRP